jgi:hypothetical protein
MEKRLARHMSELLDPERSNPVAPGKFPPFGASHE